jgi:lipoprotein-releasing system permease protein
MFLAFKIAKRYFYSKKKQSFISIISLISMLGVGIGTMALVIVMSVFNGLEDLNRQIFKSFDPDIKIKANRGKFFEFEASKKQKIEAIEGVRTVIEVIEDNTLASYNEAQTVITFKGVDTGFIKEKRLQDSIIEGDFVLIKDSLSYAIVGVNVANTLSIRTDNQFLPLVLSYPKKESKSISFTDNSINEMGLRVSGIFMLEQSHDNYIYIPIGFAEELTDQVGKRTSVEIMLNPDADITKTKQHIKAIMGENFEIKDQDEQNIALFRAIKIEKLFIFITLLFIIGIASFNIFFSLTMLAIDKTQDVKTLAAMGADKSLIQKIFMTEGAIVGLVGAFVGLAIGLIICLLQLKYGFVKMGMQTAIHDNYPVKIKLSDLVLATTALILITFGASYFPAKRAASIQAI